MSDPVDDAAALGTLRAGPPPTFTTIKGRLGHHIAGDDGDPCSGRPIDGIGGRVLRTS